MEQFLLKNGFELDRRGTKHPIYTDGTSRILLPAGTNPNWRINASLRSQVRRALELRSPSSAAETLMELPPEAEPELTLYPLEEEAVVSPKKHARYKFVDKVSFACRELADLGGRDSTTMAEVFDRARMSPSLFYAHLKSLQHHGDLAELFELYEALALLALRCTPLDSAIEEIERQTQPPVETFDAEVMDPPQAKPKSEPFQLEIPMQKTFEPETAPRPQIVKKITQSFDTTIESTAVTKNQNTFMEICNQLLRLSPSERTAVLNAVDQFFQL